MATAIVDAGPLYAAADARDRHHAASIEILSDLNFQLVIPALVVTEVAYFIGRKLGSAAEAQFVESLSGFDVRSPEDDWSRIAELVRKYSDFPLGSVDASVIALAERMETPYVFTLDYRHFRAVRPQHVESFTLLP